MTLSGVPFPERLMCFCATANFVDSAVLGAIGVATLTEVKHRRELLFAAAPMIGKAYAFTSLWCAYAAVVSVNIYFFLPRSCSERPANYTLPA